MNSKWIQWSMTFLSAAAFGVALVASGCGGGNSVEEPDNPKEMKKSSEDKSAKDVFKSEKGMPELDPKLEEQLKGDVNE